MIHGIQAGPSPIGHQPLSEWKPWQYFLRTAKQWAKFWCQWDALKRGERWRERWRFRVFPRENASESWFSAGHTAGHTAGFRRCVRDGPMVRYGSRWQEKVCWTQQTPMFGWMFNKTVSCKHRTISHPPLGKQNYWDPIKTWFVHCQVKLLDGKNWRSPTLLQQCPIPIQALLAVSSLAS